MNRTLLLVVSAGALALVALVAGRAPVAGGGRAAPPVVVSPGRGGALTLATSLGSSHVAPGVSTLYAKLDLTAGGTERVSRVPVNLALAIDCSGSMSDGKMESAIRAAESLIEQLQPQDRLAIIAFDDVTSIYASDLANEYNRSAMRAFVRALQPRGSTNIGLALQEGYAQIRRFTDSYEVSRVLLISDGQPTVGITSVEGLASLAATARDQKISTSAFGLDFNAGLMRDLASRGGGATAFLENTASLAGIFAAELKGASELVARDVKVTLTPAEGVTVEEVMGYSFTRVDGAAIVSLYDFSPRQTAQLLVRLKVNAPAEGRVSLGTASLWFVDVQKGSVASALAPLSAQVGNEAQVAAGENADVAEMAKRVDISARVAQAQAAYSRGDPKSAFDIMASTRQLFGASVDALAGEVDVIEGNWRRGGDYARRTEMQLTKKTMKNFGQNNSY
jgi:Ca-activated chloride channel homolog